MQYLVFLALLLISANSLAAEPAGKTMTARGKVNAVDEQQASRKLKRRSLIYSNEVVSTGQNSKAQLRMTDGGMIALKQNTQLVVSDYQYSEENGRGSVVMELVKGGLRSVTGAIKAQNGDYNLKTPVGSIGIRGTHFEVELVNGEMFLAVWDGAIDVAVNTDTGIDTVSFGEGEDYSYGKVSESGEVTQLLSPPENFEQGHSTTSDGQEDGQGQEDNNTEQNNDSQNQDGNNDGQGDGQSEGSGDGQGDGQNEGSGDGQGDGQSNEGGEGQGDSNNQQSGDGQNTDEQQQQEQQPEQSQSGNEQGTAQPDENPAQPEQAQPQQDNANSNPDSPPADAGSSSEPGDTPDTPPGDSSSSPEAPGDASGPPESISNQAPDDASGPADSITNTPPSEDLTVAPEPATQPAPEVDTPDTPLTDVTVTPEDVAPPVDVDTNLATEQFDTIEQTSEIAELIASRTGSFTYNSVLDSSATSTLGDTSGFNMDMTIDFDTGTIPGGQLSFADAGGEWFATFNGLINIDQLNLDITFASHGNNLADGDINAVFQNGLDEIWGNFTLFEILNPDINTNGSFVIGD